MSRYFFSFLSVFFLFSSNYLNAEELTARDIIQKQIDLHTADTEYQDQQMILIDRNGEKEQRLTKVYKKEFDDGSSRSLIVFLKPDLVRGTALRKWEYADKSEDQWLFLPAIGKEQRIASGSVKSYFMGTDFTYEDFESENLDEFEYSITGEEELNGLPHYIVESLPVGKKKSESAYSRRLMWIEKEHLYTSKIEYYNKRNKLQKTLMLTKFENITASLWRPQLAIMKNSNKHSTVMKTTKTEIGIDILDKTFEFRFIDSGEYLD